MLEPKNMSMKFTERTLIELQPSDGFIKNGYN
jgi:hypothetical protein